MTLRLTEQSSIFCIFLFITTRFTNVYTISFLDSRMHHFPNSLSVTGVPLDLLTFGGRGLKVVVLVGLHRLAWKILETFCQVPDVVGHLWVRSFSG